jgi:hypothetical protein
VSESTRIASARKTAIEPPATFRNFAAPRTHGAVLIDPPLVEAGNLIDANKALVGGWDVELVGESLASLRKTARREVLRSAQQYVRSYRDNRWLDIEPVELSRRTLVMSGHQPTLFHPGVWFKNFALSDIATEHDAVALNLVVDNDLAGAASIRCPTFDEVAAPRQQQRQKLLSVSVPYDGPSGLAVPYEQRWIADASLFQSFPTRLREALAGVVDHPLVDRLWPHAVAASRRCANLGCSLAQGRHALEAELGLETLELPMSSACRTRGFSSFVLGVLNELPRFQACYNESLHEYRVAHGIRSSAHPVPALGEVDGWLEAPLWIYGDDDGRRRGAWVRQLGDALEISDRAGRLVRIDKPDQPAAIDQFLETQGTNFKIRPRALVTTMFARLVLSDLFLHGIGGAKYDQLGDRIIERFFEIQAPEYCVISATVLLPGWQQAVEELNAHPSVAEVTRSLRDIRFSPELFSNQVVMPEQLLRRKRELLAAIPPRGAKRDWHREMVQINRQLAEQLDGVQESLRSQLSGAGESVRELQVWLSESTLFQFFRWTIYNNLCWRKPFHGA